MQFDPFVGSSGLTEASSPRDLAIPQLLRSKVWAIVPFVMKGPTTVFTPNLGGDPYFTDGLRAVMKCTDVPVELSDIQYFNWDWPPETKPYIDAIMRSPSEQCGENEHQQP